MLHKLVRKQVKGSRQQTLAKAFKNAGKSKEFSRQGVLEAVAVFVVCDDQVSHLVLAGAEVPGNDLT